MRVADRDHGHLDPHTSFFFFYQVMYSVTLFNTDCLIPLPLYQFYTWPKINEGAYAELCVYICLSLSVTLMSLFMVDFYINILKFNKRFFLKKERKHKEELDWTSTSMVCLQRQV